MDRLEKIYRESTWGNTTQTVDDWRRILDVGTAEERFVLFEYLFREAPWDLYLIQLFSESERVAFTAQLTKPYHRAHTERRRLLWRSLRLGEKVDIPGLRWNV